jgi:hypothetical protein
LKLRLGRAWVKAIHLGQERNHYEELRGDMLTGCLISLALVFGVDALDAVDEEGGLALTHDGVNDPDGRDTLGG